MDLVLNDQTPTTDEAEVTFGTAKLDFYWLIYNMRISFPDSPMIFWPWLISKRASCSPEYIKIWPELLAS